MRLLGSIPNTATVAGPKASGPRPVKPTVAFSALLNQSAINDSIIDQAGASGTVSSFAALPLVMDTQAIEYPADRKPETKAETPIAAPHPSETSDTAPPSSDLHLSSGSARANFPDAGQASFIKLTPNSAPTITTRSAPPSAIASEAPAPPLTRVASQKNGPALSSSPFSNSLNFSSNPVAVNLFFEGDLPHISIQSPDIDADEREEIMARVISVMSDSGYSLSASSINIAGQR